MEVGGGGGMLHTGDINLDTSACCLFVNQYKKAVLAPSSSSTTVIFRNAF